MCMTQATGPDIPVSLQQHIVIHGYAWDALKGFLNPRFYPEPCDLTLRNSTLSPFSITMQALLVLSTLYCFTTLVCASIPHDLDSQHHSQPENT